MHIEVTYQRKDATTNLNLSQYSLDLLALEFGIYSTK